MIDLSITFKPINCWGEFLVPNDIRWPWITLNFSVNDLTVISEDEFYFTNDSGFSHQSDSSLRLLEMFVFPIFKGFGSVGYCNDGSCKIVRYVWLHWMFSLIWDLQYNKIKFKQSLANCKWYPASKDWRWYQIVHFRISRRNSYLYRRAK